MNWEVVIGLEIHAQLATESKIFSGAAAGGEGGPNEHACAIDLGLPGTLPVLNARVIELAVRFGLAVDAAIASVAIFARKNYFYPDLPKGYQISQLDHPIVGPGHLDIPLADGSHKRIGITRAHLEEDAGKSLHEDYAGMTGIDLNRAGTPLLEIVSEPDLRSAAEAVAYMRRIHQLVTWLGISDGNMERGNFRCDANVSLRPFGQRAFGTRTELKNINSFRFVERAILFEIERQREVLEAGGTIVQETRLYDPERDETRSMRSKETATDYRYFPDPDLLPVQVDPALVAREHEAMPELPWQLAARLMNEAGLSADAADYVTSSRATADWFAAARAAAPADPRRLVNWMMGECAAALKRDDADWQDCPLAPAQLAQLVLRIDDGTLNSNTAKTVFDALWSTPGGEVDAIIEARGLKQLDDADALALLVNEVVVANPDIVEQIRSGKNAKKAQGYLMGQIMKASGGKANPQRLNALLRDVLAGH